MDPKIACGYFLLLRNKKQLILMASFLAAARQPKRMAEKIACGYFLLLRNKKQLISMASFLAAARQPKRKAEEIAAQRLFLYDQ